MAYSIAFHLIGLVFWLGGLAIITRFMQVFALQPGPQAGASSDFFRQLTVRVWRGFVLGGLVLSTVTGIYQLTAAGMGFYMKQGWFHGKLTLLLVLYVVTFLVGKEVSKVSAGAVLSKKRLIALHAAAASILVLIVLLTIVGRAG